MLLGWVIEGGELGGVGGIKDRTKKMRGLGTGLGYWGAMRAAWEFLGELASQTFANEVSTYGFR